MRLFLWLQRRGGKVTHLFSLPTRNQSNVENMIKEICYEIVLAFANFLGGFRMRGFYDNKKVYKKHKFLKWEVFEIQHGK